MNVILNNNHTALQAESLKSQLQHKLALQYKNNLFRSRLKCIRNQDIQQKNKLNFASNDYLGFANNPIIINQLQKLLPQLGTGSGASSLITGYHHIHQDLEQTIAKLLNCEQAILFPTGYMANLAISDVLLSLNQNTIAIHDHNNHASLLDGTRLADCKLARFKHNDIDHLDLLLNKHSHYQNKILFTESLFSMDGDFAPIKAISNLLNNFEPSSPQDSALIIDHSHGFGLFDQNLINTPLINNTLIMGTFGKAIGSAGAFVAGPKIFIESLVQFARPYIYTTSLSPINTAASLLSIKLNQQDTSYREKLFTNVDTFCNKLLAIGLTPINNHSPIQPIIIGNSTDCIKAAEYLHKHHIIATAIRSPTVPINKARLRITLSAKHSIDNIHYLIKVLDNMIKDLNINIKALSNDY